MLQHFMYHQDTTLKVTKGWRDYKIFSAGWRLPSYCGKTFSPPHSLFLMFMILVLSWPCIYLSILNKCFLNLVKSISVVAGVRVGCKLGRLCGWCWLYHNRCVCGLWKVKAVFYCIGENSLHAFLVSSRQHHFPVTVSTIHCHTTSSDMLS